MILGVADQIERLRRQQSALADFGTFAFREEDLQTVLTEAARVCAKSLNVPYAKICRYRREENDLFVVAGVGWNAGVVGRVVSTADETTTQGRAFVTGAPVILEDISKNNSFKLPDFYADHKVSSTVDVLIQSKEGSWGVLEVDSKEPRKFDQHDIIFLTGFANIVAEAVMTSERTIAMRAIVQMKVLSAEKGLLIEEREENERHLRELQAELHHIARLNAMGQMAAAIAHELNQPLEAIANYVGAAKLTLQTIAGKPEGIGVAQEMIDNAQAQVLRAGKIVRNFKDMVEKRDAVRSPENIEILVREVMRIALFGAHDAHIAVELTVAEGMPLVLVDRVQIQQILFNLIRNAVEAMHQTENRKLTIAIALGESGFVDVTVRDSGPGLPAESAEHLFQPFFTTKDDGMGLGLMICSTLAVANGGRIWNLESNAPGAAFRFCVPYAQSDALPDVA